MAVLEKISGYLAHRRRVQRATRAARHFSTSTFPQDVPAWSMVAENRSDACVVYMTYERAESSRTLFPYRFFKVDMSQLTVNPLPEDYYPKQWGPHL